MNAQSNVRFRPIAGIREVREKSRYGTLEGGEAGMSTAEMVWAVIGALIVIIVLWKSADMGRFRQRSTLIRMTTALVRPPVDRHIIPVRQAAIAQFLEPVPV